MKTDSANIQQTKQMGKTNKQIVANRLCARQKKQQNRRQVFESEQM